MNNLNKILAIGTILASSVTFALEDKVIATYDGGVVHESEINKQLTQIFQHQPAFSGKKFADLDRNLQESLVKGYISSKLIERQAMKSGLDNTSEFKQKLASIKTQLLQQEMIQKEVSKRISEKEIDQEYNALAESMKDKEEVKASHILVDSQDKALQVCANLKKGAKFADVAKEVSKDEGSKVNGGELGYFTKGQMVPEFEAKAFSMKVGEISEPVKSEFGWHIIKLDDKRKVKLPSKDQAKGAIVQKLQQKAVENYVENLQTSAKVNLKF